MQKYARILNGQVVELFNTDQDITELFHPDLIWVPADTSVEVGWSMVAGDLVAPLVAEPQSAPVAVSMRQARRALFDSGLLALVTATVNAMDGAAGDAARIDWEFSQEVRRDYGLVVELAPSLGLSSEQLDQLFSLAASF